MELDGAGNHTTTAQLRRDRANELKLRRLGLQVIRYDWDQVHDPSRPAVAELQRRLGA